MSLLEETEISVTTQKDRLVNTDGRLVSHQARTFTKIQRRLQLSEPGPGSPTVFGDSPLLTADQDDTPLTLGTLPHRDDP